MYKYVRIYSRNDLNNYFSVRENEIKIGEKVLCIDDINNWQKKLKLSHAKYVIVGIPEDIGIRANYGRAGASSAYAAALKSFLSMQDNKYLNAHNVLILGEVFVQDLMESAKHLNTKNFDDVVQLRKLTEEIDKRVHFCIKEIFFSGKIPIVIGGGHNNAFPIIHSAYDYFQKKINVINCDAHSDLRPMEGRHSGNGFRYAMESGFLEKYHILGLHEQYISENVLQYIQTRPVTFYNYEDIYIREKISFNLALKNSIYLMKENMCGIELDMDAITNVPSSARTSSGISPIEARKYIYACSNELNVVYLHLAEAAPETAHLRADYKTGKLLAYLICDFIKGNDDKKI